MIIFRNSLLSINSNTPIKSIEPVSQMFPGTPTCMISSQKYTLHRFSVRNNCYDPYPHAATQPTLTFNTVRSAKFFTFSLMQVSEFELRSRLVNVFWFHQLSSSLDRSKSNRTSLLSQSSESLRFHTFSGTTMKNGSKQNQRINTIHSAHRELTPNLAIAPSRIRDPGP